MIKAIIFDCYGVLVEQDWRRRKLANEQLFSWIRANRNKYVFGILSNIERNWIDTYLSDEQQAYFADIAASSEIGVNKPNPDAYKIAAARLNIPLKQCLFIDDVTANVLGAEATGMKALHYTNFMQFGADVQKLLD